MLDAGDIKKLIEFFATKQDLEEKFVTKDEFHQRMDDIFTKLDGVFGELKVIREEQSAHSQQHEDIGERFTKIESIPSIASHLH